MYLSDLAGCGVDDHYAGLPAVAVSVRDGRQDMIRVTRHEQVSGLRGQNKRAYRGTVIGIKARVNEIATTGRVASGVKLMNLSKDEDAKVVGVVRVWETDDDDEDGAPDSEIEDESESTKEETEE